MPLSCVTLPFAGGRSGHIPHRSMWVTRHLSTLGSIKNKSDVLHVGVHRMVTPGPHTLQSYGSVTLARGTCKNSRAFILPDQCRG